MVMLLIIVLVYIYFKIYHLLKHFNEDITKCFSISYESWTTDRKLVDTAKEVQIDISSASNINSPLYLISAEQKTQRTDPADGTKNL